MILCHNTDALQRPVSFLLKVARNPSICPQTLLMSLGVFPEQALQALLMLSCHKCRLLFNSDVCFARIGLHPYTSITSLKL